MFTAWQRQVLLLILMVCCVPFLAGRAEAHPHAFIDIQTTVILDSKGQMTAIEQEWIFDEFYTLFITEEVTPPPAQDDPRLKDLAKKNLVHIKGNNYFIKFINEKYQGSLSEAYEVESSLKDGKLWMKFSFSLGEAISLSGKNINFSIYDETYYIEMKHKNKENIRFRGVGAENCTSRLIAPKPTFDMVALAAARDKGAQPDSSLGQFFAETVVIGCR
jgi:ABC-type uncharacterized transport system substrate-binding protein